MRRFRIDFASTRLASWLIGVVVLQIMISAIVPQQGVAEGRIIGWRSLPEQVDSFVETLWLDRIYFSPVFLASLALLAVNLLAGNFRRFRTMARTGGRLLQFRHVGSVVFHLALLVILAGIVLHGLFRFDGVMAITEGQTIRDETGRYLRIDKGLLNDGPTGSFALTLERIDRRHPVADATTEAAFIAVRGAGGADAAAGLVRINGPFRWEDFEFHYGARTGVSPEVLVLDEAGRPVFRSFVRLEIVAGEEEAFHEGAVDLPLDGTRVRIRIMDRDVGGGSAPGRLTVSRAGAVLFAGEVAVGDTAEVDGLRVTVPNVRAWCDLHVVLNPWLGLVFTGFWLGLAGLLISVLARVLRK